MRLSTPRDDDPQRLSDVRSPPRPEWATLEGEASRPLVPSLRVTPAAPDDGLVEERHANGQLAGAWYFADGVLNGPFSTWHDTGMPEIEAEWSTGRPHQLFVRWWPTGEEMVRGRFEHGEPVGRWSVSDAEGAAVYSGPWRNTLKSWLPRIFAESVPHRRPARGR